MCSFGAVCIFSLFLWFTLRLMGKCNLSTLCEKELHVTRREKALSTDVRYDESVAAPMCFKDLLQHLAPLVNERLLFIMRLSVHQKEMILNIQPQTGRRGVVCLMFVS